MGSLLADLDFYRSQYPGFTHEKGRPHAEVLKLMRSCDVFCLPSLYEGRALVMQEAMSQGLPVVITPNTGGEDLVVEGKTGFLVPIRSPEKIAEKLAWFNQNRQELPAMKEAAMQHAASYTWPNYSQVVIDAIRKLAP
jgi:glycosyltransferase involved in cell wall biosynthesis